VYAICHLFSQNKKMHMATHHATKKTDKNSSQKEEK
jgi:hypothetical protein